MISLLLAAGAAGAAQAQLRLPGGLPTLPQLPNPALQQRLERLDTAPPELQGLPGFRLQLVERLLERHPRELARDPTGAPILREQLLAQPSGPEARARLAGLPLRVIEETRLEELDLAWLLLRAEAGQDLDALLRRLRAIDPEGRYDYHHLYQPGAASESAAATPSAGGPAPRAGAGRVGLIDSGVDAAHPALRGTALHRHGCQGRSVPAPHGTAVASLLVGRDGDFRGALAGATLYAADAYCGEAPDGGSVQALVQALAWLVRERVAVINISLVGPPNALLQRAVAAAQARGHLLVAAVGNDGPAAPPLYPAAWPGVVGVTAVDARRRVLAEAGRGPQVMFAAPGSDLAAAAAGERGYVAVRGTSFAAPLVAGLLAAGLAEPDAARAQASLAELARTARDLGASGRDDVYGQGLVGEPLRTARPR